MTGMYGNKSRGAGLPSGAGELDVYLHDTVKYIGGVANKLLNVATGTTMSGESEESDKSPASRASGGLYAESAIEDPGMAPSFRTFEDLDMLVSE